MDTATITAPAAIKEEFAAMGTYPSTGTTGRGPYEVFRIETYTFVFKVPNPKHKPKITHYERDPIPPRPGK